MVAMLDDGVNALYAARPQGTFAYAQRLPGSGVPTVLTVEPAVVASSPSVLTEESRVPVSTAASSSTVLAAKSSATVEPSWNKRYKELLEAERTLTGNFTLSESPPDPVISMASWVGNAGSGPPICVGTMKNNNSPALFIDNRPEYNFPIMSEAMKEVLRHAPTTPRNPIKSKGAAIKAPLQRFGSLPKPPPPPIEDLRSLEGFAKVVALQKDIAALALVQKMQNEAKWEAFGSMPSPPGEFDILDEFLKEDGVKPTLPALGDVDSGSSALAGSTARLAFTAIEASAAAPDTYVAGIESFQSKEGALFDVKDFDGGGGGIFVWRRTTSTAPSALPFLRC